MKNDGDVQVASLRRVNFAACGVTAAIIGWLALSPAWLGATFAAWSALPLLAGVPAAIAAAQRGQQLAVSTVTTISFIAGLAAVHEVSRSVDPFTRMAAWALPAFHLAGAIVLLGLALLAVTYLRLNCGERP